MDPDINKPTVGLPAGSSAGAARRAYEAYFIDQTIDPYGLKFKLIIETAKTAKTPKTHPVRTNGKDRKFEV